MAYQSQPAAGYAARKERRLLEKFDAFFTAIGQGFNAYAMRRGRMDEIRRLNAMSDEQLLKLGVTRDRIPQYVFRDLFYV